MSLLKKTSRDDISSRFLQERHMAVGTRLVVKQSGCFTTQFHRCTTPQIHWPRMPHEKNNTYKESSVRNTNQEVLQGPLDQNHRNCGSSYGQSEEANAVETRVSQVGLETKKLVSEANGGIQVGIFY